ncbi:hypothetical protein [Pelagicoccus albus]|uniref:Uncharacterized protein n=1 Tax=Pelagicoccus albus TaxID=415222 RepID=A0A7X1B4Q2_9BACT|nr:hypothetical protein [Pelagicoccus albus]MBC2605611.1 hypothetical protein [Pelagicoccus albus]
MNLQRSLQKLRVEIEAQEAPPARQLAFLSGLNVLTGASFSAINLCDASGRLKNAIVWPISEEIQKAMEHFSPKLSALIGMEVNQRFFEESGFGKAIVMPDGMYRNSALYREVYQHLGMEYVAWYFYPSLKSGDVLIVGISSASRAFSHAELRRLEKACSEFESVVMLPDSGDRLPLSSTSPHDHFATLDESFVPTASLPEYLFGAFLFFYGSGLPVADPNKLPETLTRDIQRVLEWSDQARVWGSGKGSFAWSRKRQGRQLNLHIDRLESGLRLSAHEDLSVLRRLSEIKSACFALDRDGASIFSACTAILDGVYEANEVLRLAGLGALKESSARRIVSKANSVLKSY